MKKEEKVKEILKSLGSVVIAYSGGVDSTLLLKLSLETLGKERVLAVTAKSPTYPEREVKKAQNIASLLDAHHLIIETREMENSSFYENPPDRCYHCKKELFSLLRKEGEKRGFSVIADGCNADDLKDYRPGKKAAEEMGVRSPLAEARLSKDEVRKLAKKYALPNWDKPSFACLASRIPYGMKITLRRLKKIEKGEGFLQKQGFTEVRLRDHGDIARIEVGKDEIAKVLSPSVREKIAKNLKKLGYLYVTIDLEGYRSGSLNKMLTQKSEKKYYLEGLRKGVNFPKIKP
jgi:uncharacterized protein